jgi:hypothetical protein
LINKTLQKKCSLILIKFLRERVRNSRNQNRSRSAQNRSATIRLPYAGPTTGLKSAKSRLFERPIYGSRMVANQFRADRVKIWILRIRSLGNSESNFSISIKKQGDSNCIFERGILNDDPKCELVHICIVFSIYIEIIDFLLKIWNF